MFKSEEEKAMEAARKLAELIFRLYLKDPEKAMEIHMSVILSFLSPFPPRVREEFYRIAEATLRRVIPSVVRNEFRKVKVRVGGEHLKRVMNRFAWEDEVLQVRKGD